MARFLQASPLPIFVLASLALLLGFAASPVAARSGRPPTSVVFAELGGATGEALSLNYDARYAGGFGFRLGATLNPGALQRQLGEAERDRDEPYRLLGLAHFFLSEGPLALEVGAGPVLDIEAGRLSPGAAGHLGVRVQPLLGCCLVRVGYSPAFSAGGYEGFVGVGVGYEL